MIDFGPKTYERLKSGTLVANRYLIREVIGSGGMGAVYEARDQRFSSEKLVAIKEVITHNPDPKTQAIFRSTFEREANLLASINHPGVSAIYDFFTEENRSYLVLQLIIGRDIEKIINETIGFVAEEDVMRWGIELCDILHYLHNHEPTPIIFRDMKPSNVMINEFDNRVMVVDFGIAKQFRMDVKHTIFGTEGYAPPEQYQGIATPQGDVFSLGATLHHILTKRDPGNEPPFSFKDRPIRQINPAISSALEKVIYTSVEYDTDKRYKNAVKMKEALIEAAGITGLLPRISRTLSLQTKRPSQVKPEWVFTCEDDIRGNPTLHRDIIFVGSYDHHLYALDANTGRLIWKYKADGPIACTPAVIHNIVLVGSVDHRIHAISVRTGNVIWTYQTKGSIYSSPYVSEGHLFIGSDDGYLYTININSGKCTWRASIGEPIRSTPCTGDGTIYFSTQAGMFYCLDFKGNPLWNYKTKREIISSPLIHEGVVYFCAVDSTMYALDSKNGWLLWNFKLDKGSISSPVIHDNKVFFGTTGNSIYCIDIQTTKEVWRYPTDGQVNGSVSIHDETLFCGCVDGYLYCIDKKTGYLQWKFASEGPITGAPVTKDNLVYFGSTDNNFYAVPIQPIAI